MGARRTRVHLAALSRIMTRCAAIIMTVHCVLSSQEGWTANRPLSRGVEDYANRVTQEGVTIAIDPIDPERLRSLVRTDVSKVAVEPIMVVIHNGSGQPYMFRRYNVTPRPLYPRQAAKDAYRPTVRDHITCFVLSPLAFLSNLMSFDTPPLDCLEEVSPILDFFEDHLLSEADGRPIAPGRSRAGLILLPLSAPRDAVDILLENVEDSRRPLKFHLVLRPAEATQAVPPSGHH